MGHTFSPPKIVVCNLQDIYMGVLFSENVWEPVREPLACAGLCSRLMGVIPPISARRQYAHTFAHAAPVNSGKVISSKCLVQI